MSRIDELYARYGKRIEEAGGEEVGEVSEDYLEFKKEMMPAFSRYEKWCQRIGSVLKLKLAEKDREKIQRKLDIAHLEISPEQTVTFAFISTLMIFFIGVGLTLGIFLITESFPFLFLVLILLACSFVFYYFYSMPFRLAQKWRLKASSQMVPAILYIVVYMRHTSNLERAIGFAAKNLEVPLALDLKKIFWDVETGKYSSIKDSLDAYLETWRDYSTEFIESFHLIESSLYEPSESQRIVILEKALQFILDGVYDKMLRYSHTIRSPLTNIYMLGIVLPTLGLAILPLASTLLQGLIKWYHVFVLFNIIIPFFVFYLTNEVMLKRPGGYGETELLEKNPNYRKYRSNKPYLIAAIVCIPLLLLGMLPLIFQFSFVPGLIGLERDYTFNELGIGFMGETKIFDFHISEGKTVGPFGPLALLLSLFVPFSVGLFFMISYRLKTRDLIKAREDSKELEREFTGSLFQLGNRLGDGMPAELVFSRMMESVKGLKTEEFFRIVNLNIQQQGMDLENALFNEKRGAIIYFPSRLIATSMRILVESVKKGLDVAARSLMSISEYVKNINKINERLRDLLAEVVSDMKSNATFLAPLLAGVVVGLTGMISFILGKLQMLYNIQGDTEIAFGNLGDMIGLFELSQMIPPYYLQIAIGIYIIQIIFILTNTLVTVDSGEDRLKVKSDTGKYAGRGALFYFIVALGSIVGLSVLAAITLGGVLT
jgi:hypothetical protein